MLTPSLATAVLSLVSTKLQRQPTPFPAGTQMTASWASQRWGPVRSMLTLAPLFLALPFYTLYQQFSEFPLSNHLASPTRSKDPAFLELTYPVPDQPCQHQMSTRTPNIDCIGVQLCSCTRILDITHKRAYPILPKLLFYPTPDTFQKKSGTARLARANTQKRTYGWFAKQRRSNDCARRS